VLEETLAKLLSLIGTSAAVKTVIALNWSGAREEIPGILGFGGLKNKS